MLENEKINLLEELEEAREIVEQQERQLSDQSQELGALKTELEAVQQERQNIAQQQVRKQLDEQFGNFNKSAILGASDFRSSHDADTSQFNDSKSALANQLAVF